MNVKPRKRGPTVQDVAQHAGVARATAARVLGDYGSVRPDLRARVLEAAEQLGYRPNRLARSMASGATRTVGAVIADIGNPFFSVAVRGIADVARQEGFELVLVNSDEDPIEERAAVQVLVEKQVDGLIVAPAPGGDAEHLERIRAGHTPMVLLDRNVPGLGVDAVIVDGLQAGIDAVGHLIGLGHERIAVVTDVPTDGVLRDAEAAIEAVRDRGTAAMRLAGYVAAMRLAGLPLDPGLVRRAPPTAIGAREATGELLNGTRRPTAVFATDNVMTLGAFMAFQDRGVVIPIECSLFGFDDPEWAGIVRPPLTVVEQPVYELGAAATRLLISRINGDDRPTETVILPARLVIRQSTDRPPAQAGARPRLAARPIASLTEM